MTLKSTAARIQRRMIEQSISRYNIIKKLGAGGMGEVYLAEDTRLQRQVALKLLPVHLIGDQDSMRRFRQEARAVSALNHPNILTLHEIGEADGYHFIVTEFIEGQTLRSHLTQSRMAVGAALDIAIQATSALVAAHAKGVVHRDIKPENIMLRHDGYVKVLDFGLAKLTERRVVDSENSTWAVTQPGLVMGTLQYMSPEQARGQEVDARTDIWSVGLILYEAVSGQAAHIGTSAADFLVSILESEPPPLTQSAPEAPAELERIVNKCLKKDRDQRYGSAEELLDDLKRLKRDIESGVATANTIIVGQPRQPAWLQWRPGVALGLIAVLACAIFAYVLFSRRSNKPVPQEIRSLAVLPLENLSGDATQDYFTDGMTEALISDLAKIGSLRVISRTTMMRYKKSTKSIPEIARELNVDGLVEGSVSREGDSVRISVRLVQAVPEERQVLVDSYTRNLRDVMVLHSEVARSIARQIRIKLAPGDESRLTTTRSVNPEAYDAYLKGMFYLNQAKPEATNKGLDFLNEAVAKDPTNALPYAYLALGYATLGHGPSATPDAFALAREAAHKALELDETVAEAHLVLAQLIMYDDKSWDWPAAEHGLKRASELNPTLAAAHAHYAWYVVLFDRWDEGFASMRQAQEVDPLGQLWPAWQGSLYWWSGRYDEAIRECQKSLALNPNFPVALSVLGRAYSDKGLHKEAIAAQEQAVAGNSEYLWSLGYAYARAGRREDALRVASEFKNKHVDRYEVATIYAALGDKEETLRSLQTASDRNDLSPWARNLQVFASLREDPRFKELFQRMKLPG